jgi:hypothetical protein
MRFERRVTALCAQALAADNDNDVRAILAELRMLLHQHIEQLRNGLLAYPDIATKPAEARQPETVAPTHLIPPTPRLRTWQQVVHELTCEKDQDKALQLSQELAYLLQRRAAS